MGLAGPTLHRPSPSTVLNTPNRRQQQQKILTIQKPSPPSSFPAAASLLVLFLAAAAAGGTRPPEGEGMGANGDEASRIIVPMAVEGTPEQLAFVQESKLQKRKENVDWAVRNRERKAAKRQRIRDEHKVVVKRPEDFVTAFRNKERDFLRMRTRLKVRKQPPVEALSSKLVFAIRIPG
jgi:large subunit ribosomal protein L7e